MFDFAVKEFGTIDILVANAGLQPDSAFHAMTLEEWNKVLNVNLTGQFLCARAATREFLRRGVVPTVSNAAGKIICMSSVHQEIPWAGHANYATSKGGIKLLMESMAQELAPQRIRVNAIAPGAIRTPINTSAWDTPEAFDQLDDADALWPHRRTRGYRAGRGVARVRSIRLRGRHDVVRRRRHDALSRLRDRRLTEHAEHYDVIVIGSGPGGASLAHKLAPTRQAHPVAGARRLSAAQPRQLGFADRLRRWRLSGQRNLVRRRRPEFPSGTALLCRRQFQGLWRGIVSAARARFRGDLPQGRHVARLAAEIRRFRALYAEAERLFMCMDSAARIHEPPASGPFPIRRSRTSRASRRCSDSLRRDGLHPFHLPLGILLDEKDGKPTPTSICIRCDAFDGFPCLLNGKADAQVMCVDPALRGHPNLTLLTGAYVSKLETDAAGRTHHGRHGRPAMAARSATRPILWLWPAAPCRRRCCCCGRPMTGIPKGLANGSDQVGRNYMRHNQSVLMALMREPNDTVFQKTLAVSDYYFGPTTGIIRWA